MHATADSNDEQVLAALPTEYRPSIRSKHTIRSAATKIPLASAETLIPLSSNFEDIDRGLNASQTYRAVGSPSNKFRQENQNFEIDQTGTSTARQKYYVTLDSGRQSSTKRENTNRYQKQTPTVRRENKNVHVHDIDRSNQVSQNDLYDQRQLMEMQRQSE